MRSSRPRASRPLFAPRDKDSNKGKYGHVLIVAGSRGKSGAAAMAGLAALRAGAGLVTVACPGSALDSVAAHAPELMTEPLPETPGGVLSKAALDRIRELSDKLTLVADRAGHRAPKKRRSEVVHRLFAGLEKPMVIDADALNCLSKAGFPSARGAAYFDAASGGNEPPRGQDHCGDSVGPHRSSRAPMPQSTR